MVIVKSFHNITPQFCISTGLYWFIMHKCNEYKELKIHDVISSIEKIISLALEAEKSGLRIPQDIQDGEFLKEGSFTGIKGDYRQIIYFSLNLKWLFQEWILIYFLVIHYLSISSTDQAYQRRCAYKAMSNNKQLVLPFTKPLWRLCYPILKTKCHYILCHSTFRFELCSFPIVNQHFAFCYSV